MLRIAEAFARCAIGILRMTFHALDNPIWRALTTRQAHLAVMGEKAGRYAREVAPFVAVEIGAAAAAQPLGHLVEAEESVYLLGVAPPLSTGWRILEHNRVTQMICRGRLTVPPGPQVRVLTQEHWPAMLELTGVVYPGFFRARTPVMGTYLGIYCGDVLAAMAGERMCLDGYQEVSAVCTHPDYTSRGFAARLVALLTNGILERGLEPFLHVSSTNGRARGLYERLGYEYRAELPLWSVQRT